MRTYTIFGWKRQQLPRRSDNVCVAQRISRFAHTPNHTLHHHPHGRIASHARHVDGDLDGRVAHPHEIDVPGLNIRVPVQCEEHMFLRVCEIVVPTYTKTQCYRKPE